MANKKTPYQRYQIQRKNEKRILEICPNMPTTSGIYLFYRINENNEPCVYIGQSINLLQRCAGHLSGRNTHIDKSLLKHKLYSAENPTGWKVMVLKTCNPQLLDQEEQKWIEYYKNREEVVIYNVTGGGQFDKKENINERLEVKLKTYKNGKNFAAEKVRLKVKEFFDKYLDFIIKSPTGKIKERKFNEFKEWLNGTSDESN